MARGDKTIDLRQQREALDLIKDIEAYLTPGLKDGAGEELAERKKLVTTHDDLIHDLGDQDDKLQRYCPSCFLINATRRIKEILSE